MSVNTKIKLIVSLIGVVILSFILFIVAVVSMGGFSAHGDFTLCGILIVIFSISNIVIGFVSGPFNKITDIFNNWQSNSTPDAGTGCSGGCAGCLMGGFGYLIYIPFCFVFILFGWIFGIIAVVKLLEEKRNQK